MKVSHVLAATTVLAICGSAFADTILLSDNFNGENSGVASNATLNYNTFTNWIVNPGTVDLIGNGYFDFQPGYGLYVDMDGSTSNAGTMTSRSSWTFSNTNTYKIEFDLAGNHRNGSTETVAVSVQIGNFAQSISLGQNVNFTHYSYTFTGNGTSGAMVFAASGGDNVGMLLDNVKLSIIPLPQTAATAFAGLMGVAGVSARRRRNTVN